MEGKLQTVRASFGAAAYPSDAGHPEALVHAADAALYEAKRAGRGEVAVQQAAPAQSDAARPAAP